MQPRRAMGWMLAWLVSWPGMVGADDELAERISAYRQMRGEPCAPSRTAELLSGMLDQLDGGSTDMRLAAELLTLLSISPHWRGANGRADVDRVWELGWRTGLGEAQLVDVVKQADGQLLHVLNTVKDPAHRAAELEALHAAEAGRSRLYAIYLRSNLAEQHEQLGFGALPASGDITIADLQGGSDWALPRAHLRKALQTKRDALVDVRTAMDVAANLEADFLFQIAKLQVLLGDPEWRATVADIGAEFADWREYYHTAPLDHVYVERFLALPAATAETPLAGGDSRTAGAARVAEQALSTLIAKPLSVVADSVRRAGTAILRETPEAADATCVEAPAPSEPAPNAVRASLNPIQLARHLCAVATQGERHGWEFAPSAFDGAMREFQNRDYRVALLHREDAEDASEDALRQALGKMLEGSAVLPARDATGEPYCAVDALSDRVDADAQSVRVEVDEAGGYLYVGGDLTYLEATRLTGVLRDVETLEVDGEDIELDPYALRPRLDG